MLSVYFTYTIYFPCGSHSRHGEKKNKNHKILFRALTFIEVRNSIKSYENTE